MKLSFKKQFFIPLLVIITCLGFFIRLQVCRELAANDKQVVSPSVYTDMYTYKLYSEQILKGEYKRDFYYQPFYYAVFLPAIKQIFGFGVWPVIIFQCVISALTIWFSSISSAMLWGRRSAVVTALFLAFLSMLILYTPYHLIATLQAFWVSLICYLILKELEYERKQHNSKTTTTSCIHWGLIGFVVSLGILTRGNIWFFVPGIVLAWILNKINQTNRIEKTSKITLKASLPIVLFLVMIILPQIPFSWKNTQLKGKFCGPSTAAGAVLSLGNTPESPPGGRDAGTGPGPMEYPETCLYWNGNAEKVSVEKRIWSWICREPLAFVELQWRKMLLFWDRREIPNNIAAEHQGFKSPTWLILGLIPMDSVVTPMGKIPFIFNNIIPTTILLLVFSLAGIFLLIVNTWNFSYCQGSGAKTFFPGLLRHLRGHIGQYLIFYFIVAYWLGTAAFYILARFRVPVYPMLAIFAGAFINQLFSAMTRRKKITAIMFCLLSAFILVNYGYDFYRYNVESKVMNMVRPNGVVSPLDEELLILDNGPFSFGSWQPIELKENMQLTKIFSIPPMSGEFNNAKVLVELVWEVPGTAVIGINGKKYILKEKKPIKKAYEFPMPVSENMEIAIVPYKIDARIFAIMDMQRNYHRTTVNGKDPGAELVCKLNLSK